MPPLERHHVPSTLPPASPAPQKPAHPHAHRRRHAYTHAAAPEPPVCEHVNAHVDRVWAALQQRRLRAVLGRARQRRLLQQRQHLLVDQPAVAAAAARQLGARRPSAPWASLLIKLQPPDQPTPSSANARAPPIHPPQPTHSMISLNSSLWRLQYESRRNTRRWRATRTRSRASGRCRIAAYVASSRSRLDW